jgi:hypothetical protein
MQITLSLSWTQESTELFLVQTGYLSILSPHSPHVNIPRIPSESPQTTLDEPLTSEMQSCSLSEQSDLCSNCLCLRSIADKLPSPLVKQQFNIQYTTTAISNRCSAY